MTRDSVRPPLRRSPSLPPCRPPPTVSCSANPSTVVLGGSATITAVATSPEGRPLTYSWTASSGTISGSGNTATLNATGTTAGTITVICKVTDDQGLSASATTAVAVTSPASAATNHQLLSESLHRSPGWQCHHHRSGHQPRGQAPHLQLDRFLRQYFRQRQHRHAESTGATAGTITVICKVTDDQGLTASATTAVAVTTPASAPPTISCSANPSTVVLGGSATITAVASQPRGQAPHLQLDRFLR